MEQTAETIAHHYGLALRSASALILVDPGHATELYRVAVAVLVNTCTTLLASREALIQELRQRDVIHGIHDGGLQVLTEGLRAIDRELGRMQQLTARWPQPGEEGRDG